MKKIFNISFLFVVAIIAFTFLLSSARAEETISAGSLLKTANSSTIYYLAEDNKLYIFPNDKTYFSWFDGFDDIKVVSEETFGSYTLGGNVYYKPGSLLIKTPSSLKVYAVGVGGELRWLQSEELAREFYGENWNKLVDDVPDGFFTNYFFGNPINTSSDYDPDEEEEQSPTVSHARKLKTKEKIKNRIENRIEKRCNYLKNSVNRLQKRAERWGLEIPTLGDDYIAQCVASAGNDDESEDPADVDEDKKVTVCKSPKGNPDAAHTIRISRNALKKHFREGYRLGNCENDDDDDDDSDDDDDTVAPVISSVTANPATSSAVITWLTNESADSKVLFDNEYPFVNEGSVTNNNDVTNHIFTINGLTPDTLYHYIVISKDSENNEASSTKYTFITDALDNVAPIITNIDSNPASTSALITWTTNEASDSKVSFRSDTSATSTIMNSGLVTSHSLSIIGLATSTQYYFTVESKDEQGNATVSIENEFTTD